MRKKIQTLDDLKDSRLLYDKDPPPFGIWLIMIVLFLLIAIVLWSVSAKRTYVIKSSGTITSTAKNYIMSSYTGEITFANVGEGDYVQQGDILFRISSTDLDLQAEQIKGMIRVNSEKIAQYERLERCTKEGVNRFDENNEEDKPYYYQYETYMNQVGQKEIDASAYKAYDYTDAQIESAIKANEAAIAEIYYSTLKNISDSIQTLKSEIDSYNVQLESIHSGQNNYPITASASGMVHMDTEYKVGMVVQAASAIGSIVSENDTYIATVYTSANDMPLIHVGDLVDISISGLTQSIYGTLGGVVTYIASEPTNHEDGSSTFLVKIALDSTYLISNQGNKVNISNGMAVEARIQYDEVSYFYYVLESLGVLIR